MSRVLNVITPILTLCFALPQAHAVRGGPSSCQITNQNVEECKTEGDSVVTKYQGKLNEAKMAHKNDMNKMSQAMSAAATECAVLLAAAAKNCEDKQPKCDQCQGAPVNKSQCKRETKDAAGALLAQQSSCTNNALDAGNTAAATTGDGAPPGGDPGDTGGGTPPAGGGNSGGGSDSLMPMLMGAGLGAMAGMMMAKDDDKDKDKEKKKEDEPEEGETPRDPADCTVAAGANDSRCNAELESKCSLTPELPVCAIFVGRYCGDSAPPAGSDQISTAAAQGEGKDSAFCKDQAAVAFCKENGRAQCISCVEMDRKKGAACKSDPSACVAQYSQTEIDAAKQSCPIDPKFSDPSFTASTGGEGAPAVVLPQSVSRGPASDIGGQYSASVFSVSTGIFKKMCEQGRLNCGR